MIKRSLPDLRTSFIEENSDISKRIATSLRLNLFVSTNDYEMLEMI